jgi:hypothetical protein
MAKILDYPVALSERMDEHEGEDFLEVAYFLSPKGIEGEPTLLTCFGATSSSLQNEVKQHFKNYQARCKPYFDLKISIRGES